MAQARGVSQCPPGDEAEAELAGDAAKGFSACKMRVVGRDGFSIANCVRRVKAARRGLGPGVELMIDAHGSLEVATAIKLARELEPYDIAWFEEPVSPDDHAGQAEVRRSTTIPIASGEREFTRFDFVALLERRALDIAQPDVARAGGMTEIRRIAALTSTHSVRLAPHAWSSGVLFAASIHVAMSATNCHVLEGTQGYMPMMWELFDEPFDIRPDGTVHAPGRAGLGFTLRKDALELLPNKLGLLEFVNADSIALGLSPFNPDVVAVSAGRVMLCRMHELTRAARSFALETTCAGRGATRRRGWTQHPP